MKEILKLQQKIVPELIEVLEKRYNILRTIYYNEPIGRRILANHLNMGERIVRTEINFLKSQDLIDINTPGMTVTEEGEYVLEKLKSFIHEIKGLADLEIALKSALGVKHVVVVPGNIEEDESVLKELGRAAANYVKPIIESNMIIALTGGSTIKELIDNLPKLSGLDNVLVVPARGGMGRKVETQANTLAANLAKKVNGSYKMLHVPDTLSDSSLSNILHETDIIEIMDNLKKCNMLMYGIGRADDMCRKRGLSEERTNEVLNLGAIGEAYGCYFDRKGNIVYKTNSIGVNPEYKDNIKTLISVAGGPSKAEAIIAAEINNSKSILITDEGAGRKILELLY